jgi:hypothetical protein
MFPLYQWNKFHLKVWSWLKGGSPQGYAQSDMECDLKQYESKVETIVGIHLQSFMGVNSFEGVRKPSQKNHL